MKLSLALFLALISVINSGCSNPDSRQDADLKRLCSLDSGQHIFHVAEYVDGFLLRHDSKTTDIESKKETYNTYGMYFTPYLLPRGQHYSYVEFDINPALHQGAKYSLKNGQTLPEGMYRAQVAEEGSNECSGKDNYFVLYTGQSPKECIYLKRVEKFSSRFEVSLHYNYFTRGTIGGVDSAETKVTDRVTSDILAKQKYYFARYHTSFFNEFSNNTSEYDNKYCPDEAKNYNLEKILLPLK
jgi:hypothetical protein